MVKANRHNLRPRPLDHGDPRTPIAWQHRNLNYQQNQGFDYQTYHTRLGKKLATTHSSTEEVETALNQQYQRRPNQQARPTSSTTESDSSSSTAEPDRDSQLMTNCAGPSVPPDIIAGSQPRLGTLRSMQSTLSTWDGEPCPVHSCPSSVQVAMLVTSSPSPSPYPIHTLPPLNPLPAPMLLPPMLRPRPLVLPADNPAPPTPLPVRDPKSPISTSSSKNFNHSSSVNCCTGNIVLFWVILIIVFIGVLLGVITRLVVI